MILSMKPSSLSKIVFMDLLSDDPCVRKPDITIANNILEWYPKVDLSNGFTKTIIYHISKVCRNGNYYRRKNSA